MSLKHSDGRITSVDGKLAGAYEAPSMQVVGNLRDLLAGTGSQLSDNTTVCNVADAVTVPPECQ
jgi:hypothetical protein